MRFVVDECLGPRVAWWLEGQGHDVISIFHENRGADDGDILAGAHATERVVLTADKDFGDLVFRDGRAHSGIVLLRLDDETAQNVIRVLNELLDRYADDLGGRFVVVTETGVRFSPVWG